MHVATNLKFHQNNILYSGKVWRINSFQVFDKRKFGELIDQPIDYLLQVLI